MTTVVSLSKGANVSLTKTDPSIKRVLVGLGWDARSTDGQDFDLDASAFLLSASGKVRSWIWCPPMSPRSCLSSPSMMLLLVVRTSVRSVVPSSVWSTKTPKKRSLAMTSLRMLPPKPPCCSQSCIVTTVNGSSRQSVKATKAVCLRSVPSMASAQPDKYVNQKMM